MVVEFIGQHKGRFGVAPICRTLGVSESAYYHRRSGPPSRRRVEDERLVGEIRLVHQRNWYAYGHRRIWRALQRDGHQVGRDRVRRLMREQAIRGAKRSKRWRTTLVSTESIRNWIKQTQADRGERPEQLTRDEQAELRRLRRQVRELEQEREILKRAVTFFVRETDRR